MISGRNTLRSSANWFCIIARARAARSVWLNHRLTSLAIRWHSRSTRSQSAPVSESMGVGACASAPHWQHYLLPEANHAKWAAQFQQKYLHRDAEWQQADFSGILNSGSSGATLKMSISAPGFHSRCSERNEWTIFALATTQKSPRTRASSPPGYVAALAPPVMMMMGNVTNTFRRSTPI